MLEAATIMSNIEIPKEITDSLINILISSPFILITVVLAYVTGHLWAYMVLSYFSKKERNILYSTIGKIGLGIIWFALILLPIHGIIYKNINFTESHLKDIIITDLVVSLALQAIIFGLNYFLHRKG